MNAAIQRKLMALEHPEVDSVKLEEDKQLRVLVKWAENRKIRFYAPEDRKALDAIESATWHTALQAYIKDLGGEAAVVIASKKDREVIVDWLLSYAIGMEYSDRADTLQKLVTAPSAPTPQAAAARAPQPKQVSHKAASQAQTPAVKIQLDIETPEFRKSLEGLADTLGLPHDDSSEAMVRACAAVLEQKLSAAARERAEAAAAKGKSRQQGQHSAPKTFSLKDFPPGFDTGDEQLNKAAALLRLLYVSDLRRLQDDVNSLIASMQDYTANPKTDSSLGKVGR